MTTQEFIGNRIRILRKTNNLTQTELASLVGYKNKTAIAKIETGKIDLPLSKILAFANALHTDVSYFFDVVSTQNMEDNSPVLTLGDIIKERRKSLELSADDVAKALGVSRATIYRYENAEIKKIPTSMLEPLATVLKCSPSYLIGWDSPENDMDVSLSDEEKELILKYRKISSEDKEMINRILAYSSKLSTKNKS